MSGGGVSHRLEAVFAAGTRSRGPNLTLHYLFRNDERPTHLAVAVSKKIGGAVERNRIRRRVRGATRKVTLKPGFDVIVNVRPTVKQMDFQNLQEELGRLLEKTGIKA